MKENIWTRMRPCTAFTLVELLVVIAIIGILIALLLPSVQAARESARRIQCQNNLHNLALAVLNFENQQKALPQSCDSIVIGERKVNLRSGGTRLSWIVRILPFMEQQQLYDQFDLNENVQSQDPNLAPESRQIDLLLCPSDQARGRMYQHLFVNNKPLAKGNYAAYASPEHCECMPLAKGAMIHVPQPLSHVVDGTSSTVMLTEVRTRDEILDQRGAWAIAWVGASILGVDMHATTSKVRICNQKSPPPYVPNPIWSEFALTPNSGVSASIPRDDLYQCVNSDLADLDRMPCWTRGDTTAAPRSLHAGGVNCANVDGSVRWLTDEVEPVVLGTLVCIDDGLVLEDL